MIDVRDAAHLGENAYVPEHMVGYVNAVSGAEAFLVDGFLVYQAGERLVFVGYPPGETFDERKARKAWDKALRRFRPGEAVFIGPELPAWLKPGGPVVEDRYYLLDLERLRVSQKVRNMLTRARREVTVAGAREVTQEHVGLIESFLRAHDVEEGTRHIFSRIGAYVTGVPTARLFEARDRRGGLVAFDVAEFGAAGYAFYMFNFRSLELRVPGVSDLLLAHLIEQAGSEAKRWVNMGLGISPGVVRFKTKWGARPFLQYVACSQQQKGNRLVSALLDKL